MKRRNDNLLNKLGTYYCKLRSIDPTQENVNQYKENVTVIRSNLETRMKRKTEKGRSAQGGAQTRPAQDVPLHNHEWVAVLNEYCHDPELPNGAQDMEEPYQITRGELLH